MQKKHLIILRGLPGSGKTTLAKIISENGKYPIFSVDDYFTNNQNSEYVFDFSKNHIAYKKCLENCENAMKENKEKIILHNVFSMEWEIKPYLEMANKYNYTVHIASVENYHNSKNTHAISEEQIQKMASKYKVKLF